MEQLIQDWVRYCHGELDVDKSHFLGLLSSKPNAEELQKIFKYMPLRDEIITNLTAVYEASRNENFVYLVPNEKNKLSPEKLKLVLSRFLTSQKVGLLKRPIGDEMRTWLEKTKLSYKFVSPQDFETLEKDLENFKTYLQHEEYDNVAHNKSAVESMDVDRKLILRSFSGIEEALYGLAADFNLANYVMSPMLVMGIDYSGYFEFWKGGGVYAITEEEVIISSIWEG